MIQGREGRDVLMALVIALVCSTVVRTVTAELTGTVGRVWPFSLVHAGVQEGGRCTPGCPPGVRLAAGMPSR